MTFWSWLLFQTIFQQFIFKIFDPAMDFKELAKRVLENELAFDSRGIKHVRVCVR